MTAQIETAVNGHSADEAVLIDSINRDVDHPAAVFKGTIPVDILDLVWRHIQPEHSETRVVIGEDGWYLCVPTEDKTGLQQVWLPTSCWTAYECSQGGIAGMSWDMLRKIVLLNRDKADEIDITVNQHLEKTTSNDSNPNSEATADGTVHQVDVTAVEDRIIGSTDFEIKLGDIKYHNSEHIVAESFRRRFEPDHLPFTTSLTVELSTIQKWMRELDSHRKVMFESDRNTSSVTVTSSMKDWMWNCDQTYTTTETDQNRNRSHGEETGKTEENTTPATDVVVTESASAGLFKDALTHHFGCLGLSSFPLEGEPQYTIKFSQGTAIEISHEIDNGRGESGYINCIYGPILNPP